MGFLKSFWNVVLLIALIFSHQAFAELLNVDISGTVLNTYIVNGKSKQIDAEKWSLNELFQINSLLNLNIVYDTSAPQEDFYSNGTEFASWYRGVGISIGSDKFHISSNPNTYVWPTLFDSSDENEFITTFGDRGIKLEYEGEAFYLSEGDIAFHDESKTTFTDPRLPSEQNTLDAVWLNKPAETYWLHPAGFHLLFFRDPMLDLWNLKPTDELFFVIGYFDSAKLSPVSDFNYGPESGLPDIVPDPTSLPEPSAAILLIIGIIALVSKQHFKS